MARPRSPLTEQIRRGLREPHLVLCLVNEWFYDLHSEYADDHDDVASRVVEEPLEDLGYA